MAFADDNGAYEKWLRDQCRVVEADLAYKHRRMREEDAFTFLRATYFRWAATIEGICPDLSTAPRILAVGDTHVENFGTWRDGEGRLVWGNNDFDEAAEMPWPFDLVRLTASAILAPELSLEAEDVADAILAGYRRALDVPRPTLLDEQALWMRPLVACSDKDRQKFWDEIDDYPAAIPPSPVQQALAASLPVAARPLRFATRRKGGGGLGRPRYVVVADWRGGRIVREAKALVPSGWDWAHDLPVPGSHLLEAATGPFRAPDPFLSTSGMAVAPDARFVLRRIAADARKVELGKDAGRKLKRELLTAMGFDIGSIHAADRLSAAVADDCDRRATGWLGEAATRAAGRVKDDWRGWKRRAVSAGADDSLAGSPRTSA